MSVNLAVAGDRLNHPQFVRFRVPEQRVGHRILQSQFNPSLGHLGALGLRNAVPICIVDVEKLVARKETRCVFLNARPDQLGVPGVYLFACGVSHLSLEGPSLTQHVVPCPFGQHIPPHIFRSLQNRLQRLVKAIAGVRRFRFDVSGDEFTFHKRDRLEPTQLPKRLDPVITPLPVQLNVVTLKDTDMAGKMCGGRTVSDGRTLWSICEPVGRLIVEQSEGAIDQISVRPKIEVLEGGTNSVLRDPLQRVRHRPSIGSHFFTLSCNCAIRLQLHSISPQGACSTPHLLKNQNDDSVSVQPGPPGPSAEHPPRACQLLHKTRAGGVYLGEEGMLSIFAQLRALSDQSTPRRTSTRSSGALWQDPAKTVEQSTPNRDRSLSVPPAIRDRHRSVQVALQNNDVISAHCEKFTKFPQS